MVKISSPPSSEPPSNDESSFSPWLRHSRNIDGKGGYTSNMSSPEKEISSRSNFFRGFTAGHQDNDIVNRFCKGVRVLHNKIIIHRCCKLKALKNSNRYDYISTSRVINSLGNTSLCINFTYYNAKILSSISISC